MTPKNVKRQPGYQEVSQQHQFLRENHPGSKEETKRNDPVQNRFLKKRHVRRNDRRSGIIGLIALRHRKKPAVDGVKDDPKK